MEGLANVWGAGLGLVGSGPERERRRGKKAGGAGLYETGDRRRSRMPAKGISAINDGGCGGTAS